MESQNRTPLSEFHFHFWAHIVACSHSGESGATKRFSWELHTTSQLGASRVLNCVSICDFVVVVVQLLFIYFTILYWFCHTSTWIRHRYTRVPHPGLLSQLPPHAIPLHHPNAPAPTSCIIHRTWTDNSFHLQYYTCFNAILPNHHTLALSHRVQRTVLYICVAFAFSHIGLSLPSF